MTKLRIAVTGLAGHVVTSLIERAPSDVEVIAIGRPHFDLAIRGAVVSALRSAHCDAIINAAAYTAVDVAESEPALAMAINGDGPGYVAEIAAELRVPLLHLSTDYVFDGASPRPYREDDPTQPIGAYGRSKLEGEKQVSARCANSAILRTSWIYSPFGTNFVKTMLRLGEAREEVGVVADQIGNPTSALDLADALVAIAKRLVADPARKFRGVFNISGAGEATWADFAEVVFGEVEKRGRRPVHVKRIATADYPTLTQRPANSCLDNSKLRRVYGLTLPPWRNSVVACVARLMQTQDANQKD